MKPLPRRTCRSVCPRWRRGNLDFPGRFHGKAGDSQCSRSWRSGRNPVTVVMGQVSAMSASTGFVSERPKSLRCESTLNDKGDLREDRDGVSTVSATPDQVLHRVTAPRSLRQVRASRTGRHRRTDHSATDMNRRSSFYPRRRHKSGTPGQGTRPTSSCRPRALTRRDF